MKELDKKLVAAKEIGAEEKNEISNLNENVEGNDSKIHRYFHNFHHFHDNLIKLSVLNSMYFELFEWC